MYNQVAYLRTETKTGLDDNLNEIYSVSEREVFVRPKSIGCREFYEAATASLKPSITLTLADYYDYSGEKSVRYEDKIYDVLRTYVHGREIDLTLEERVGGNG